MKIIQKFISFALSISMAGSLLATNVSALTYVDGSNITVVNDGYYKIQHVESGKLLDIRDENRENGAVLQIWEEYPGNNNQIYKITSVGNYKIILQPNHVEGKIVETRNSRTEDHAEVGMWDYVGIPCQEWYLYRNDDGTYSFKNSNSGLYLNVEGNNTSNGTRVIQYHDDGTTAMRFNLFRLDDTDIITAKYRSNDNNVEYSSYPITTNTKNFSHYSGYIDGKLYLPTTSKKYLYSIQYLDYYTLLHTIGDAAKKETIEEMFKQFSRQKATDIGTDMIVDYAQKKGLGFILDLVLKKGGYVIELMYNIYISSSNKEWNDFVDHAVAAMEINSENRYFGKCGLKVTTYNTVYMASGYGPLNNGSTAWGTYNIIKDRFSFSYSTWDEMGINRNMSEGRWTYHFK